MAYQVAHRNGQGGLLSDWYRTGEQYEAQSDAETHAFDYAEQHPESDGWNKQVAVLDDDGNVVAFIRG